MRRASILTLTLLCCAASSWAADGPRWTWPEEPKDLQVLGPEVKGQKLGSVMRGFTRALGVRCVHCHVGEEGKPLSTYDFVSNDNPNKGRAREMLRMLADINGHLAKIEPSEPKRVNMWCHTCHHGRPRPTTLDEELRAAYDAGGVESMRQTYATLREPFYGKGALDFGPTSLAMLGNDLLEEGDLTGAIAAFRLNSEQHPESSRVWHFLAAAYEKNGQPEIAEIYYRKALEVDPENAEALAALRRLRAAPAPADSEP